jgi:P pilus assembly chaperone PapD
MKLADNSLIFYWMNNHPKKVCFFPEPIFSRVNIQRNPGVLALGCLSNVLLSSFLLWGIAARADIAISPLVIETEVQRGQAQGTITVRNGDAKEFRARVYSAPFTYDAEQGFKRLESSPQDLTPYLQFSPRELQVPSSAERRIRFVVRFPPSLPDGEYRAMLFTENLEATIQQETDATSGVTLRTAIVPSVGVAVYVRKGKLSHNLSAISARYNPQSNKVQLLVRNTGKASAILQGEWTIKKGEQEIYKGLGMDTTVLAEGERYLDVDYAKKLEPGQYQLSGTLGWGVNRTNKIPFSLKFTVP